MLRPEEAWERLEPHLAPLPAVAERRDAAGGRVLAAATLATADLPPWDVAAMDGYAVGPEVAPGRRLAVGGVSAAGDPPGRTLAPGTALRIMTGAPLPAGADRVVPVELSDRGREQVVLEQTLAAGANVRRRAEILAAGDELLPAGSALTPGALSLLASQGHAAAQVHRAPRVAVLTTGDELVSADREPGAGELRDSNTDFLLAAGRRLDLDFEPLGIAPDDPEALRRLLAAGLAFDVLLVCGGVSAGEFDFVEGVLEGLGCEALFTAVAMQPGRPLVAARHPRGLVFGLPGNPASVMVGFWLFVRPALRRLLGFTDGFWRGALHATLAAPLPAAKGRDRFLPASAAARDGALVVTPHAAKGSHDLAAYARGNALARVRPGAPEAPAGARCEILPLGDWPGPRATGGSAWESNPPRTPLRRPTTVLKTARGTSPRALPSRF